MPIVVLYFRENHFNPVFKYLICIDGRRGWQQNEFSFNLCPFFNTSFWPPMSIVFPWDLPLFYKSMVPTVRRLERGLKTFRFSPQTNFNVNLMTWTFLSEILVVIYPKEAWVSHFSYRVGLYGRIPLAWVRMPCMVRFEFLKLQRGISEKCSHLLKKIL